MLSRGTVRGVKEFACTRCPLHSASPRLNDSMVSRRVISFEPALVADMLCARMYVPPRQPQGRWCLAYVCRSALFISHFPFLGYSVLDETQRVVDARSGADTNRVRVAGESEFSSLRGGRVTHPSMSAVSSTLFCPIRKVLLPTSRFLSKKVTLLDVGLQEGPLLKSVVEPLPSYFPLFSF